MAILQGTMSDGTLIPVQADSQGRLVCEGLPGATGPEGPQGPQGPEGPEGPPGPGISLPPNPVRGDVLAWDNGLIWLSGLVTTITYRTADITNVETIPGPGFAGVAVINNPAYPVLGAPQNVWAADENAYYGFQLSGSYIQTGITVTFSEPISGSMDVRITCPSEAQITTRKLEVNGTETQIPYGTYNQWVTIGDTGPVSSFSYTCRWRQDPNQPAADCLIHAIRFDGGPHLQSAPPQTRLTFANAKDLSNFALDDQVTQDDSAATGVIQAVDTNAFTMDLAAVTGTWGPANTGRYVLSPPSPLYQSPLKAHR